MTDIISTCKEKLKEIGHTTLLIPTKIEDFMKKNPNNIILCNEITERIASLILQHDFAMLKALSFLSAISHPDVSHLLNNHVKKGDHLLVHHYYQKNYYTSVIVVMYTFDGAIIFQSPRNFIRFSKKFGNIEFNNIVAVAKIPKTKLVAQRFELDNDQEIFLKIAKHIIHKPKSE